MRAVIDRIEGERAVLELQEGETAVFPSNELPDGAREGDVLVIALQIDRLETERRREKIEKKMEDLWLD